MVLPFRWVYLTQLYQAIAYKTHINMLERHKCTICGQSPNAPACPGQRRGQGRSMGSLYWQLNDVWAAPTWSTIDAAGQWKIAQYLAVNGTSSSSHPIGRSIVSATWQDVALFWVPPINAPASGPIKMRAVCSSQLSFKSSIFTLMEKSDLGKWTSEGCPVEVARYDNDWIRRKCPSGLLTVTLENGSLQENDTQLLLFPKEMADKWPQTAGSVNIFSVKEVDNTPPSTPTPPFLHKQIFQIQFRAQSPEAFVWLVVDPFKQLDGWFSRNAFNMLFEDSGTVYFYLRRGQYVSERKLWRSISIYTLASVQSSRRFHNL